MKVSSEICISCSSGGNEVKKLDIALNLNQAPLGYRSECVACPCCDQLWSGVHHYPLPRANKLRSASGTSSIPSRGNGVSGGNNSIPTGIAYAQERNSSTVVNITDSGYRSYTRNTTVQDAKISYQRSEPTAYPHHADEPKAQRNTFQSHTSKSVTHVVDSTNYSAPEVLCECGVSAVLLTVSKEGDNKGRKFYKCNTK